MNKGTRILAVCFLIIVRIGLSHAQSVHLKSPLTDADRKFLKQTVTDCFGFSPQIMYSYSTTTLFNHKTIGEKPASLKNIEALKKELKGNDDDRYNYLNISGMYSRLGMTKEADEYRMQSVAILQKLIAAYPDSAEFYCELGAIKMGHVRLDESIALYRKAWSLEPEWVEPPLIIANQFLMRFQLDSSMAVFKQRIKIAPDSLSSYYALPVYYLYEAILQTMNHANDDRFFMNLNVDSLSKMPLLDEFAARFPNNANIQYTQRVGEQVLRSSYTLTKKFSDTTFDRDKIVFNLTEKERAKLLENKTYFESLLKQPDETKYYMSNKMLASIHTLLDEPQKAVAYTKKVIALKPKSECNTTTNTAEDYNNLASLYYILRDTVNYEKTLLEKIKVQPAVDPDAADNMALARLYLCKKKYDLAKAQAEIALSYKNNFNYNNTTEPLLFSGIMAYLKNDYDKAIAVSNEVYGIDNQKWEMYILYGCALLEKNDAQNAYEMFKIAEKLHDRDWIREDLLTKFFEK